MGVGFPMRLSDAVADVLVATGAICKASCCHRLPAQILGSATWHGSSELLFHWSTIYIWFVHVLLGSSKHG
jgi:hypothetical protein